MAEVAVDAPKRKNRKKKAKNDKFGAAQKCKTLQACQINAPPPVGGLGAKSAFCSPLQEIIDDAQYDHYPSWVPNFASVAAAPSMYPKRSFCPITGLLGKYKCPMTGEYLATLPAYETHRETRLKGLV